MGGHEHKIIHMIEIIIYYIIIIIIIIIIITDCFHTHTYALTRISAAQQQTGPKHRIEIVASCLLVGLVNNISSANIRENTSFLPNKILHTAQGYTRAYIAFPCRLPFSFCIISCFPLIPHPPPHTRYFSFSCLHPLSEGFQ